MHDLIAAVEPEFAAHFKQIGLLGGRYTKPAERLEEIGFWRQAGSAGARWLIREAEHTSSLTQAWGIADVLASMGAEAVDPIMESLACGASDELADMMLSALGAMSATDVATRADQVAGSLRVFLRHPDESVRSKAAAATSVLPVQSAAAMLQSRLTEETNPDVRAAIQDELDR